MNKTLRLFACCLLLAATSKSGAAENGETGKQISLSPDRMLASPQALDGPRFTFQVLGGFYVSNPVGPGLPAGSTLDPDFYYAPLSVRLGYLLSAPSDRQFLLRGTSEILLEMMVAPVTTGFADIIVGPSVLLRYNFVQPDARLVPYLQAGAGLVYSDGYKTQGQDYLGQSVEFLLQWQVGLHWILSDAWSLDFEFGGQHISNAGLSERNAGINNLGGSIGITYYLSRRIR